MKKKLLWVLVLLASISFESLAQKNIYIPQTFYVKITNLQELRSNFESEYNITFHKDKLISTLTKSDIYKVHHQLNFDALSKLKSALDKHPSVVYTSLYHKELVPPPNDIPPATPNFTDQQGYLDEFPGVNVRYAWSKGADGSGIRIKNLEYGLNIDHEEFHHREVKIANNAAINSTLFSDSFYIYFFFEHGTATAGVVYADDGGYGVKGIAYNAEEFVLYPEWEEGKEWDRISAVANAVQDAEKGDVIIYEMQTASNTTPSYYVPAEYDPLVWDLTKAATDKGVIIVAAAGNGNNSLDNPIHNEYKERGDSGAIIVGARFPDFNAFSTNGERINVHAWGLNVFTSGYGSYDFTDDFNQNYTDSYSGSSSATSIVGGCVASLQSYYHSLTNDYLSPIEMRDLLIRTGVPQPTTDTSLVGPLPDLKAAIDEIDRMITEGNNDHQNLDHLMVFPNPVVHILNVNQINVEAKQVLLFDSLGKRIYTNTIDKRLNEIDMSQFSSGIYYLKIVFNNQVITKKIIKS